MSKEKEDVFAGIDFGELVDTSKLGEMPIIANEKKDSDSQDEPELSIEELLSKSNSEEDNSEDIIEDAPPPEDTSSEDSQEDSNEDEDASSSTLNAVKIAKAFYEEGGLSSFDEEEFLKIANEESPGKALMTMLKKEVDYNIEEYKKTLSPEDKAAVEAKELGINPQELQVIESDINILKGISDSQLEDETVRKQILTYYYQTTTKFSPERINKEISRLEDLEEAQEEVKSAIPELIKVRESDLVSVKNKAKEYQDSLVKQEQDRLKKYESYIDGLSEIIPGSKINKTTHSKLKDMITKPVKESGDKKLNAVWAKREADPIKFDTIVAYLMMEGVFDGKWDKLSSKSKTKAFEDLESSLRTARKTSDSASNPYNNKSTKNSIAELQSIFGK